MLLVPALDDVVPQSIPYVIRGAILRGIRGVVASVISFGSVGIANGTLLAPLHLSPEISVLIAATITPALLALDKFLREKGYQDEVTNPIPPDPGPPIPPITEPTPAPSEGDVDLGPLPDEEPDTVPGGPTDAHPNP